MGGYDNLIRQQSPRWVTTDEAILRAYVAEVDRVCPCVILFHSQAGQFGFRAAQARPDKVRALVAVEPSGFGVPAQAALLRGIPTLVLYGDNIDQDARWPAIRANGLRWVEAQNAAGGRAEVLQLPSVGIHGNGHMMMMDRNNLQVAQVIQDWLAKQGLVQYARWGPYEHRWAAVTQYLGGLMSPRVAGPAERATRLGRRMPVRPGSAARPAWRRRCGARPGAGCSVRPSAATSSRRPA